MIHHQLLNFLRSCLSTTGLRMGSSAAAQFVEVLSLYCWAQNGFISCCSICRGLVSLLLGSEWFHHLLFNLLRSCLSTAGLRMGSSAAAQFVEILSLYCRAQNGFISCCSICWGLASLLQGSEWVHQLLLNLLRSCLSTAGLRMGLSAAAQFVEVLSLYCRAQNGFICGIQEIIQGWYKVC
jgi:hypothetical protein